MKNGLPIKNGIVIPESELEITTSRAGGPGGQHVNKTATRITVRWNITTSTAFNEDQKKLLLAKLASKITTEGDLIIHHSSSRSQAQNKKMALGQLAHELRQALHVPKKRLATAISKTTKESRLREKIRHSSLKKMRSKKISEE